MGIVMPALAETRSNFLEEFELFEKGRGGNGQSWFTPVRRAAIARFAELGLPTTSDEDWRFTNVAPIARTTFRLSEPGVARVSLGELEPFLFGETCRLVFVNGHFSRELSLAPPAKGLRVAGLAELLNRDAVVRSHLTRHARYQDQAFTALNTAFLDDGAVVEIAPGAVIEAPVHLVFVSTAGAEPTVSHPHTLVVAGAASQATIVESYIGLGTGTYFTNAVTEILAGDGAVLEHYKIQRETTEAFHVGTTQIHQQRSSTVRSLNVSLGAALARHDVTTVLDGEGGDCTLNGLFMAGGSQHVDNHLRVEHAQPHCTSWEYYKGILDGKAKGVFTGRIVVFKGAQKTDAKQTNMNLLLSEDAQIDTKPQLEIFADDVKCTHGATIGQIDPDALFYLRARGIEDRTARSLLIYAFASETLGQIKVEPLRRQLEAVLFDRLPEGARLRGGL